MTDLESRLEQHFTRAVRRAGGRTYKLLGDKGIPDRLVLWPGGRASLVELKAPTGTVEPAQRVWHARAAALGHPVTVLRGRAEVDAWITQTAGKAPAPAPVR